MNKQMVFALAGAVAGAGIATLVFVNVYGTSAEEGARANASSSERTSSSPERGPRPKESTKTVEGGEPPSGPSGSSSGESPPSRSEGTQRKVTSGDEGPPGEGYVKTGEITKTMDLEDLQKGGGQGQAQKTIRKRAKPNFLKVGGTQEGRLGSPDRAPRDFKFQTEFHPFEVEKGQNLTLTVEATRENGLQPFLILWKPDEKGRPDTQLDIARDKKGAGTASITHTFEDEGVYILSIDDARNVPLRRPEPDDFYGGENFTYEVSLDKAEK
jgi:hypothetical protein